MQNISLKCAYYANTKGVNKMNDYLSNYPPVLGVNDVAEILGVTSRTVRKMVKDRQIGSLRIGKRIKIPKDKLIDYLNTAN